jgi:hypothetical protein
MQSSPASHHFLSIRSKYSLQHPVLKHPQFILPLASETSVHFNLQVLREDTGRQNILNRTEANIL